MDTRPRKWLKVFFAFLGLYGKKSIYHGFWFFYLEADTFSKEGLI